MVRSISSEAQTFLDQNFGTEPGLIIDIQWVDGGSIYTYTDKDLTALSGEGKILSVSGLDNTTVVQGVQGGTSGDSQQISVTLDDTDGTIKGIIDSHDIHKEPAWVYQTFEGLDADDKFLIFKGQISSPIQWNEGDRTITFDIITRIEDAEVGFSMEEGNFDYVPEELVGEPWPLVFGTVENCPALQTKSPRRGTLRTGFGIKDYVLKPKLEQLSTTCCAIVFVGFRTVFDNTAFSGAWGAGALRIEPIYQTDVGCTCKKRGLECELTAKITKQEAFEFDEIEIIGGEFFPQGVPITLDIEGARVSGQFDGTAETPSTTFLVTNYFHPKLDEILVPPIKTFCTGIGGVIGNPTFGTERPNEVGGQRCVITTEDDSVDCDTDPGIGLRVRNEKSDKEQESWEYLSTFREAGFFWADPGSEVTLVTDSEYVYIANILPSTVHLVKAYRTFSDTNFRQKVTVPNDYYTVRFSDFGAYTTTEIVFDRPLSSRDEGWEDDIFVSQTSSVGPNTVDIMEWLIDKYTDFTWDSSFANVKTDIDNYPMNFMVPGRKNILTLLQEMAFQSRCALTLRDDEFHLTYLSGEPSEDGTITEDDVLHNSLVLDHTDTEDLVTKFIAEWRPSCCLDEPYKIILRHNVNRYGTQEQTFDFYCYNIQELVTKSATFWLIRMANTWRKVRCQTPMNKLALESIDGVYVTLPDIADGEIKCRVESAVYNSNDKAIDFDIWTPVRSGERTAYNFAYPKDISFEELFPSIDDFEFGNAGGSGPNVDVTPPETHVLGKPPTLPTGFSFGQKSPCESMVDDSQNRFLLSDVHGPASPHSIDCRPDQGDKQPTDTNDAKPTKSIQADNTTVPPSQSPRLSVSATQAMITQNDFLQEGRNQEITNGGQDALDNATGGSGGAGGGNQPGAGDLNDDGGQNVEDADQLKEYLENMPDREELEEQNRCYWGLSVGVFSPVTVVRIPEGESCGDNTCGEDSYQPDSSGTCFCNDAGKQGCVVGNQVITNFERFLFDSESERDDARATIESMIDTEGTVGQAHPAITNTFSFMPEGCEVVTDENGTPQGIIGYEGSGSGASIVGYQGFMVDENGLTNTPC